MKKKLFVFLIIACISLSILSWFLYKPVRIFLPELAGVICINEQLCIENLNTAEQAQKLYRQAQAYVETNIIPFKQMPTFIFCATQSCFENFGFKKASAQSVGTIATVVGPNGWKQYIIEHEMIHHIQNEQLGSVKFISMPQWFVEGMAYSLSQDPRETLSEPWQSHKHTFEEWYRSIPNSELWNEAKKL